MQRRPKWKPVIVPSGHRAENGSVGKSETISHAAHSKGAPIGDEDRLVDIRFSTGALAVHPRGQRG
jgi:hypothetical protein